MVLVWWAALAKMAKNFASLGNVIGGGKPPPVQLPVLPSGPPSDQSGMDALSSRIGSTAGSSMVAPLNQTPPESRLGLAGASDEYLRRKFMEGR